MEGLLLAAVLRRLAERLPSQRLPWRFVDPAVLALPLVPQDTLVIDLRPTAPHLRLGPAPADAHGPRRPFAAALAAHAAGPLVEAEQSALDRRFTLAFGAGDGFVPAPEVRLEIELAGRNANAVLVGPAGRIIAVHREVRASMNRYRELRPGLEYRPPPLYDKLDPRTADRAVLASVLRGRPLSDAFRRIDGIGRTLTRWWAERADVDPGEPLQGAALDAALDVLERLARDPEAAVGTRAEAERIAARAEERTRLVREARGAFEARRRLLEGRIADAERARAAADAAATLRGESDLLLAHAGSVPRGADTVELEGFDGRPVRLELDPRVDAAGNARRRYQAARTREARLERTEAAAGRARSELDDVRAQLACIDAESDAELRARVAERAPRRSGRSAPPGLRLTGPHGFEIVIGRSASENDRVTFGVARADDLWLHAQGFRGGHVVVRSDGREIPFDTVLFAARLAAGHSEAGGSDNVPVDYTKKRYVWRSKGMPAGAVRFTRQKTVFVTPLRRSEVE
jgi:predicted ribosome quality control (RQC) complex YloA/Tae2 family protein